MRMELAAFDPESSANKLQQSGQASANTAAHDPGEIARAVADLLQNKSLSHTCGIQGEWEVRTTLVTTRRAWRYQSRVYGHGKEARKSFPPIDVVRTSQARAKERVTEEILLAFASEAVEVHFARCASVSEYAVMASIFAPPPSRYRRLKRGLLICGGVAALLSALALLPADKWWQDFPLIWPAQSERRPPSNRIQWQSSLVSYHSQAGEPFAFPLPTLERVPEAIPVEITLEASGDQPSWVQLDGERLQIYGTAPATTEDQTYRLIVRAHTEQGSESRLHVVLAITGQPARIVPTPQLPGHWTW